MLPYEDATKNKQFVIINIIIIIAKNISLIKKIYLFRMTHIENILHILSYGITHQKSPKKNENYISIGDGSLISKRENFLLPNKKKLGRYIPFYFGARMPMLFVIKQGNNSTKYHLKSISSEEIVYCITTVELILSHNISYLFSNGHAVSDLTQFYDQKDIYNIENIIDENAINAKYWIVENDLDLKRRKEAEFLIEDDLPASAILGYAVYNESAKQKLIALGIEENKVAVRPNYYF
jgi:hypothetical protein